MQGVVHDNLLMSLRSVLEAMKELGINLTSEDKKIHRDHVLAKTLTLHACCKLSNADISAILSLLEDEGVNMCIRKGYDYQLIDSAPYFFSNASRILDDSYVPTESDVLRCRVRTSGITVTTFKVKKMDYHIVDVGGQRSERRKWIQCFDDVRAVLFVCAMSGYDMTLLEDGRTNRLDESLNLFQAIVNNKFFEQAAMILFLNKCDLFMDKIENSHRHMRLYFPQYQGADNNVEEAKKFVESEFRARVLQRNRIIYPHFTTATDTRNIRLVIDVVVTQIIRDHMKDASLL
jgi:guanine nucleotide-binding protein subunit alpha